jgi:hypothetical protein
VSDLEVDLDALRALKDRCIELVALFDDAGHDQWDGQVALVGAERLTDAFSGFEKHWKDGRGKVKKHLVAMGDRVQAAIEQYEATDGGLATQIVQAGQG